MPEINRILLVDDDPHDVELTLTALEENNLANEVTVVHDGAEALDHLLRRGKFRLRTPGTPAVVMLDLKLPKVDGIEVLRQIRASEDLKIIPVVVLTSSREERDLVEAYELCVNAYVVKPVNFQEFVHAVQEIGLFWAIINQPPPGSIEQGG
jgi:CheY-like chemotaxis protein